MISKPLEQIRLSDLQALVGNVRESKTLEFKQALPAKIEKEVVQFLAAVSALANTAGGDLLIGIASDDGIATAIPGVPKPGFDEERLRLEQLLADNIEPRIPSFAFQSVDCRNGNHVIIIRVQRSWLSPHRVTKNDKFYGRNSAGKYPLDVGELRNAFVLAEWVADRIRAFRQERLLRIAAGNTPGVLAPSTSMVLHVIPLPSFADRRVVNVAHELSANLITLPVPLGSQGVGHGVNLDGAYIYSGPSLAECHGYGLLFRDCSIEGVKQLSQREGRPYLAGAVFEQDIVRTLKLYLQTCQQLDAGLPIYVALSFCNAKGCYLQYDAGGYWVNAGTPLIDDVVALPECLIESANPDLPKLFKPSFDIIWNAFGQFRSQKYDQNGNWIGTW